MANHIDWTKEQEQEWAEWVAARPPVIQEMCAKLPPYKLYRLSPTNQRVTIYSYHEDGTLSVNVTGEYNRVMFDRRVFDIKQEDLVECDLPCPNEVLGTALTKQSDIESHCDAIRKDWIAKGILPRTKPTVH